MKIMHTADWHLGKKIEGKSMLDNQKAALNEIKRIADEEDVDAIIIAGDVFDTAVPSSDAEELFFSACVMLATFRRSVVAIAGNHDDEVRLCAARSMAVNDNVYLVGDMDNGFFDNEKAKGGEGWLKLFTPGGTVNLALMPYPLETVTGGSEEEYKERVKRALDECAEVFEPGGINILAAHLFMMDGSEERMLGGARILPSDILPSGASYVALGHVHKCMRVCKQPPAYYSGSIVPCSFTETQDRCVKIVSFDETVTVRDIQLKSVKKLIRIPAKSFDEAYEKLKECTDYAEILYDCPDAVPPAKMTALRALPAFVKFTPCFVRSGEVSEGRKLMSDEELFEAFYRLKRSEKPDEEEMRLFLKAVRGEELL